jgi:hypothetical protein
MVPRLGYQLDGFAATVTHIATAKYLRVREHALGLFLEAGWGGLLWCHQCTGLSGSDHFATHSSAVIGRSPAGVRLRLRLPPADCGDDALADLRASLHPSAGAWSRPRPLAARIAPMPQGRKCRIRSGGLRCAGGVSPCLPTWSAELARSRFVGPSLVCHEPEAGSWLA